MRRWIGSPAFLPAMSHSAISTAPIERTVATRARAHKRRLRRSRSSGSWPITTGFRKRIRLGPSRMAGFQEGRGGGAEKGVALEPLIGRDPQQAEIALAGRARGVMAVSRRRDAVPGKQRQRD